MVNLLEVLRRLERDVERDWWWLHGALSAAAEMQAERPYGDQRSFREMQMQAHEVDRQRALLAARIAELAAGVNESA